MIERRYTKKKILESLKYWKSELAKLEESNSADDSYANKIMVDEILDELDRFDEWGSWSDVSGPQLSLVKFSQESLKKLKDAFAGLEYCRKGIGLIKIMSRAEYEEEIKYWDDSKPAPYEDYLEDEIYKFQEAFDRDWLSKIFKPTKVLVLDDVQLNHDTGKTVLVALYAIF